MSNDNELPGSMVIVAQGPDDQYAYEVPPIDSAAVAGNMFGDLIQRDIYLQKNIHYPVRSIVEQGTKEKKEINKKVSDQVDGLLKQITQGKREATRQERVDVMSAVLHKMESDLEGYKRPLPKAHSLTTKSSQASPSMRPGSRSGRRTLGKKERSTLFSSLLEMNWSGRLPTTNKTHSLKR